MGQMHEVHEMIEFQLSIGFTAGIPYPTYRIVFWN